MYRNRVSQSATWLPCPRPRAVVDGRLPPVHFAQECHAARPRVNVPVIVNRDAKDNHAREIPFAPYVTMDLIILARDRGKMDSIPAENSILKGGGVEIILTTGQHTFVELQTCLEAKFQIIPLFQSNFQLIKVRASNPISFSLNLLPISD